MKTTWILGALLIGTLLVMPDVQAQRTASLVPILDKDGMIIGASRGSKWISAEKMHSQVKAGAKFRLYTLKGYVRTSVGGKVELSEASGQAYYIRFPETRQTENEETIAVGGTWNPMPRLTRTESAGQAVYLDAVASVLKSKGLAGVKPNITKILRVDLFGKGQDAVLIEAASPNYKLSSGFENDPAVVNTYSCVILRMVVGGKLTTKVLGGAFYKKNGDKGPVEKYDIENVLDLNGDGVMEIVIDSHYYEGGGSAVFEVKSGAPVKVLEAADGA